MTNEQRLKKLQALYTKKAKIRKEMTNLERRLERANKRIELLSYGVEVNGKMKMQTLFNCEKQS